MEGSSDNKDLFKYLVLIILVLGVGYFLFLSFNKSSQTEIYKFSGEIVNIEGNSVTLYGVFVGPIGAVPERLSEPRNFSFVVDETTTFKKFETFMPSWESINAAGTVTETGAIVGSYSFSDLVNIEGEGSLEDLIASPQRGATAVEVDFTSSIHNSNSEVASVVAYRVLVSPNLPSSQNQ